MWLIWGALKSDDSYNKTMLSMAEVCNGGVIQRAREK
jgi:hypothetical protein